MWLNPEITVWLYKDRVDMRKSIDGLSIIIASNMAKNPSSGEIFLGSLRVCVGSQKKV